MTSPTIAGLMVAGGVSIYVARIRNTRRDPVTRWCFWGGSATLLVAVALLLWRISS